MFIQTIIIINMIVNPAKKKIILVKKYVLHATIVLLLFASFDTMMLLKIYIRSNVTNDLEIKVLT